MTKLPAVVRDRLSQLNFDALYKGAVDSAAAATALAARVTTLEGKFPVVSANITDGTIATADIGASQITSALIADGTIATADIANGQITTALLATLPQAAAYRSSDTTISKDTWTAIAWNGEDWDAGTPSNNMHAAGSQNFTIRVAGLYLVIANVCFDPNGTGERGLRIVDGSGNVYAEEQPNLPSAPNFTQLNCSVTWRFAVNDTVSAEAYQNSGGSLAIKQRSTQGTSQMSVTWLSP